MLASGKLKTNSLWGLYLGIGQYVVVYFIYKCGGDVMSLSYSLFIVALIFSLFIKPYIVHKEIGYDIKAIAHCFASCLKVLVPSVMLTYLANLLIAPDDLPRYSILLTVSIVIIVFSSFLFMERQIRTKLINIVKTKLHIKNEV